MTLHSLTHPAQTEHDALRKRIMDRAGLLHRRRDFDLNKLAETQWCETFWRRMVETAMQVSGRLDLNRLHQLETYMRNRLIMGAFRYGTFQEQRGQGRRHDNIPSALRRLKKYWSREQGNQELLVDVANLCMVEYIAPGSHPDPQELPTSFRFAQSPGEARSSLEAYLPHGNRFRLVEAAAYCALEFMFPQHPNPVWDPIDDGDHVSQRRIP